MPVVIAISGGSGSGKTTLARELAQSLNQDSNSLLYQDSYYFDQSEKFDVDGGSVNFDHPEAIEFSLLQEHLQRLRNSQSIEVPIYDFASHKRINKTRSYNCYDFVVVDGILILTQPQLLPLFDVKIFVETKEEVRFSRRLDRDVKERGRTPEGVKIQFTNQVKPMHDQFVEPSKENADLILSGTDPVDKMVDQALKFIHKWTTG